MRRQAISSYPIAVRKSRSCPMSDNYSTTARLHHEAVNRTRLLREKDVLLRRLGEVDEKLGRSEQNVRNALKIVKKTTSRSKKGGKKRDEEHSSRRSSSVEIEF